MIIYKSDKNFEKVDNMPNENFLQDKSIEVFVVADNSALGQKVLKHAPYFDFILDDDGGLIDIVPTERPEAAQFPSLDERVEAVETALLELL